MSTKSGMTIITALISRTWKGLLHALHEMPEFPGFVIAEARGEGHGRGASAS